MFIMAEGELPICLIAHLDTVFALKPAKFYYDSEETVLWSPEGLGADDRAGVFAIVELLNKGYKPHIIFTELEEHGGIGADNLIQFFPKCPFKECKAIIEIDRQGHNEAVYYDCDNTDFEDYISTYGFVTDFGTFSDISIIAPSWEIAAVNVSAGYEREHQKTETLNVSHLYSTIEKVSRILDDSCSMDKYPYIPFDITTAEKCACCGRRMEKGSGWYIKKYAVNVCDSCYFDFFQNIKTH